MILAAAGITMTLATGALVSTSATPAEAEKAQPVVSTAQAAPAPTPETAPQPSYYDVPLSHELQDVVFREAERWGVPPALLLAMMDQESDYRTDIISSTDDYGIMQINAINHPRLREELGITDFMDPEQSITCGAYMIGELLDKYDGDLHHALTAYNRGEGGASKYFRNNGTYETTYSLSIEETYLALEGGDETCR